MSHIALSFDHVSKKFRRGELHESLRELIPAMARRLAARSGPDGLGRQEFWALADVSFHVPAGEAFGIIGYNGAGKSTILKLLSGIMDPTLGNITVRGKLSALIEIGAGFHPDLTGRENIYLNGIILGMKRRDVSRKFEEIVEFSGLAEFIDTPVKRYSSGMFARLGFSVAAHLEPDILVIDEVLSVGDYRFQQRGVEKMHAIAESGATVIFVSHNLKAVTELCPRSLLLDRGRVAALGRTADVIQRYLGLGARRPNADSNSGVRLAAVVVRRADGSDIRFESGERVWVDVDVVAREPIGGLGVGLSASDAAYNQIFETSTARLGCPALSLAAGERVRVSFELDLHLAGGTYHFGIRLYSFEMAHVFDQWDAALTFFVSANPGVGGVVNLNPRVSFARFASLDVIPARAVLR